MRVLGPVADIRQINRRLSQRVQEFNVLHGLGRVVTSLDDLEPLLNRIVEAAVFVTKAEEGFVLLLDEDSQELYLRAGKGLGEKLARGFRLKSTDSTVWNVVRTGKAGLISSADESQQVKIKTGFLVKMAVHVPLKLRNEVIGVLSVDNRVKRQDFTTGDVHLLGALADYAAVAIDNAQRHESARLERVRLEELLARREASASPGYDPALHERVHELNRLHELGRAVTSARDLDDLLARIVSATVDLARAEEGFLLLLDPDTDELYLRAGKGLGRELATGFRVKSRDSLVWDVIETGKPLMVGGRARSEGHKIKTGYLVRSMLHVPLKLGDKVIGVLSANNRTVDRSFSTNDQELLSILADYAAVAIDNVQQRQRAQGEIERLTQALDTGPLPSEHIRDEEEKVPLEWLMSELEESQASARSAQGEAERLSQEMVGQAELVKSLAEQWRRQDTRIEALTRRLSAARLVGGDRGAEILAVTLADVQGTLDNLGAGFVIADERGLVVTANEVACHILASRHLTGRPLRAINLSSNWVAMVDRLLGEAGSGTPAWEEINFWNRGRLIKALFLPQQIDGVTRQIVVLRDLFSERSFQVTLEETAAEISQKLRTPLTVLSAYTDLLLGEAVGLLVHPQRQLLERMREHLDQMSEQIDGAAPIAPVDCGDADQQSADLSDALQEALVSASPWLDAGQVRLRQNLDEDLPPVAAQLDCLYQMIVNLLQNAVRATPAGGEVVLGVKLGHVGNGHAARPHVIISVQDQGGGVPPELLGRIFERIYQKDSLPIPGIGGSRAELPIVKTLVEAFGGRVWAETVPGVGSKYSFLLPAAN